MLELDWHLGSNIGVDSLCAPEHVARLVGRCDEALNRRRFKSGWEAGEHNVKVLCIVEVELHKHMQNLETTYRLERIQLVLLS